MSPRSAFQAKMIESLGGPLMAAVTATLPGEAPGRIAATMAELMTRSVQFGIALASSMNLKGSDEQPDAIRLALTALAGRLIGEVYRQTGAVPAESDFRKWVPALEAVLVFADKFAPSADAVMRLDRLEPGAPASAFWTVDENQAMMQYMQAFVPVVTEIGAFSFGRQEKKLIQDVADRVSSRAEAMTDRLFAAAAGPEGLQLKLGAAKALAQVYTACHREEKKRLMDMDAAGRAGMTGEGGVISLDALWAAFELRASMLEILSEGLFAGGPPVAKTASGGVAPADAQPVKAPVQPPVQPIAAVPDLPPELIEETAKTAPAPPPSSPMGFFKPGVKKPPAATVTAGAGAESGDSSSAG
jgi:hypothetical protein